MSISFKEFTERAGLVANPTDPHGGAYFMHADISDTDEEAEFLAEVDDKGDWVIWTVSDYGTGDLSAVPMFLTTDEYHVCHFVAQNVLDGVASVLIDTYKSCENCGGSEEGCDLCEEGKVWGNLNPGWDKFKP